MNRLVWFRNDLRVHDHEPLFKAAQKGRVLAVYCIDNRHFQPTSLGFKRMSDQRMRFLYESIINLKQNINALGGKLLVVVGQPEDIIPEYCKTYKIQEVYYHREVTDEETKVEQQVEKKLAAAAIPFTGFWGSTLFHLEDLPFPVKHLPDVFTDFRKKTERESDVRKTFQVSSITPVPEVVEHEIPEFSELKQNVTSCAEKSVMLFVGGETAGLKRLAHFIWESRAIKTYKETRNGLLGADYSSKLSPWLSLGCLSARKVYEEIKKYEDQYTANDSTYWMIFELLWRDYFRFVALKHGNKLFHVNGVRQVLVDYDDNREVFNKWCNGETGIPFIDANMRELKTSGFMSNRGRQNVASFLVKNLNINWLWGAMWFESQLLDYDPCSNYGNWSYIAGVGNDPRSFRYFNCIKQAGDYDSKGDYVRHWLTELQHIPGFKINYPYQLTSNEQKHYGFTLGKDYPFPILDIEQSIKKLERQSRAVRKA
ncbi:MAG: DASH family cryptochrome [Bacteroidia bacterium]|jgi:deoxyribodipyrimidine photo-lyase|nr:DASH family cryptochrome [Bacteroidia bacterium]